MKKNSLFGILMILFCSAIWGLGIPVQSLMCDGLGSYTIVFFKNLGFILLLPLTFILKQKFNKEVIMHGFILGIFMFFFSYFQQKGIELSSAGKSGFITSLYIVFVPFISYFLGRKLNKFALFGVGIAVVGMYFLCINGELIFSLGDVYLLLGALSAALQISFIDKFVTKCDPAPLACVQQFTICLISFIMMMFQESVDMASVKLVIPHLLYLIVFSSVIAEFIQMTYQKVVDPTITSLLMSFESVFSVFFGFLILNEVLSLRELFGCALIFVAIIVAQKE